MPLRGRRKTHSVSRQGLEWDRKAAVGNDDPEWEISSKQKNSIAAESGEIPPIRMSRRKGGRQSSGLVQATEVDLLMECSDDILAPCQRDAYKKAHDAYRMAQRQICEAKAGCAQVDSVTDPTTGVTTITTLRYGGATPSVQVTNNNPLTQQMAPQASLPAATAQANDDDVIFLQVEPPKPPGRGRGRGGRGRGRGRRGAPPKTAILGNNQPQPIAPMNPQQQLPLLQSLMTVPPGNAPIVLSPNQATSIMLPSGQIQVLGTDNMVRPLGSVQLAQQPQQAQPAGRPPGSIPVQRVQGQPRQQPSPLTSVNNPQAVPVPNTAGLGIKRPLESLSVDGPPRKLGRGRGRPPAVDTQPGNWVLLDEFYYGKKEGDPAYREEKGEYRFKCWYCHKMLYNNMRIMMHMQGHIDSEKQQNLDLSDLTQCKHCYKQFDTPFEMQCHVEKIHQNKSNVLVCRICEKDHDSQGALRQHMRQSHTACEMPYICQLCNFRSSVYSDVVDHFKKRHDSSQHTMCLYCLKVFRVPFSKTSGWGLTQTYYQHLQKHQLKGNCKKCSCCKLTFINKADCKAHRNRDHLPNNKGALGARTMTTLDQDKEQVMIRVGEDPGSLPSTRSRGRAAENSKSLKSLNAPALAKVLDMRGLKLYGLKMNHYCCECHLPMQLQGHFKKHVACSMCRYATTCNSAYSAHMTGFHGGNLGLRKKTLTKERPMEREMYCLCGYSSKCGNKVANHLVSCSKRTCYSSKPQLKFFEYDDEQEEFNPFEPYVEEPESPSTDRGSPERDIPSLFGALGLVKKPPNSRIGSRNGPDTPPTQEPASQDVAEGVMEGLLDDIFPAEAAAGEFIDSLLTSVDTKIQEKVAKRSMPFPKPQAMVEPSQPGSAKSEQPPMELGTTSPRRGSIKIMDSMKPSQKSLLQKVYPEKVSGEITSEKKIEGSMFDDISLPETSKVIKEVSTLDTEEKPNKDEALSQISEVMAPMESSLPFAISDLAPKEESKEVEGTDMSPEMASSHSSPEQTPENVSNEMSSDLPNPSTEQVPSQSERIPEESVVGSSETPDTRLCSETPSIEQQAFVSTSERPDKESANEQGQATEEALDEPMSEEMHEAVTNEGLSEESNNEQLSEEANNEQVLEEAINEQVPEEAISEQVPEEAISEQVPEEAKDDHMPEETTDEEVSEKATSELLSVEPNKEQASEEPNSEHKTEESDNQPVSDDLSSEKFDTETACTDHPSHCSDAMEMDAQAVESGILGAANSTIPALGPQGLSLVSESYDSPGTPLMDEEETLKAATDDIPATKETSPSTPLMDESCNSETRGANTGKKGTQGQGISEKDEAQHKEDNPGQDSCGENTQNIVGHQNTDTSETVKDSSSHGSIESNTPESTSESQRDLVTRDEGVTSDPNNSQKAEGKDTETEEGAQEKFSEKSQSGGQRADQQSPSSSSSKFPERQRDRDYNRRRDDRYSSDYRSSHDRSRDRDHYRSDDRYHGSSRDYDRHGSGSRDRYGSHHRDDRRHDDRHHYHQSRNHSGSQGYKDRRDYKGGYNKGSGGGGYHGGNRSYY